MTSGLSYSKLVSSAKMFFFLPSFEPSFVGATPPHYTPLPHRLDHTNTLILPLCLIAPLLFPPPPNNLTIQFPQIQMLFRINSKSVSSCSKWILVLDSIEPTWSTWWHPLTLCRLCPVLFRCKEEGLSEEEAARRAEIFGFNKLEVKETSAFLQFLG